jgi:hypothetical protein
LKAYSILQDILYIILADSNFFQVRMNKQSDVYM